MDEGTIREELVRVRSQREVLELERWKHADAVSIGQLVLAAAERDDLPIVVDVRRGGQIVFRAARAGTTAEHDDWVRRKVNTAERHAVPSYEFLLRQRDSGRAPDWLDPLEFAVAGGAVPVFVRGNMVGTVTVSGIVSSPNGDHDLAMSGIVQHVAAATSSEDRR